MSAHPVAAVEPGREFVLTVSCADRRGVVHAVSGVMLEQSMTILDSQQFADTTAGEFHLRMHLAREGAALAVEELDAAMRDVAAAFAMTYAVHDLSRRRRVVVLVSQQGHCLNDLLFRVESGQLPVEVPAIVSNHEDFRDLAEWHGIPFHHVPVTPDTKPAAEAELRRLVDHYCRRHHRVGALHADPVERAVRRLPGPDHQHPPLAPARASREPSPTPRPTTGASR